MKQKHEVAVLYCQKMRLQEEQTLLLKEMKNFIVYFKKHVISDLEHDIQRKSYLQHLFTCFIIIMPTYISTAVEHFVVQQCRQPDDSEHCVTSPLARTQVCSIAIFCCLLQTEFYALSDTALISVMLQQPHSRGTWLCYGMESIWLSYY